MSCGQGGCDSPEWGGSVASAAEGARPPEGPRVAVADADFWPYAVFAAAGAAPHRELHHTVVYIYWGGQGPLGVVMMVALRGVDWHSTAVALHVACCRCTPPRLREMQRRDSCVVLRGGSHRFVNVHVRSGALGWPPYTAGLTDCIHSFAPPRVPGPGGEGHSPCAVHHNAGSAAPGPPARQQVLWILLNLSFFHVVYHPAFGEVVLTRAGCCVAPTTCGVSVCLPCQPVWMAQRGVSHRQVVACR